MKNRDITGIYFNLPRRTTPIKMLALAGDVDKNEWGYSDDKVTFPLRSLEQILTLLEQDKGNEVSIIEWLSLFDNKDDWDNHQEANDVNKSSVYIMKAIVKDPNLTHLALFRAALSIENNSSHFPAILLDNLSLLMEYLPLDKNKKAVKVLVAAINRDYLAIAKMSLDDELSPSSLLNQVGLVRCTNIFRDVCLATVNLAREIKLPQHSKWLVTTLDELQASTKILFLNDFLNHTKNIKVSSHTLTWLTLHCHPESNSSLWFQLNSAAKDNLRKIIKISDYCFVQQLIRLLLTSSVANELVFDETTQKQIKSRDIFWMHYQDSFMSIKLFVPISSFNAISEIVQPPEWLNIFDDQDASTEVAIFEFKSHIIVEFFRGKSSEIRVFVNNQRNANLLLKQKRLRLDTIRKLFDDGVHDHVFLWQWACEKWLRENFKITPDMRVTKFKGLPPWSSDYSRVNGLPTPNVDDLMLRQQHLETWNREFFDAESLIKGSEPDYLKIRQLTVRASQERSLGNHGKMCEHLEAAAKFGDMTSVEILSKWLLQKPNGTKKERVAGEYWLRVHEVYEGHISVRDADILVWRNHLKSDLVVVVTDRPIRKLDDGRIGINYKSKVYPVYLQRDLKYSILLDDENYSPDSALPIRTTITTVKGLRISIDD